MKLDDTLSSVSGIGSTLAKRLANLGLYTIEDLLNHYPSRYDDFSKLTSARETNFGENVTLRGELWSIQNSYTRQRKVLTRALFSDGSTPIEIVWFNQPWLTKTLKPGDRLQVAGKIDRQGAKLNLVSPQWEKIVHPDRQGINTGRLVPVYPETFGVTSKWLRGKISQLLPPIQKQIEDFLPPFVKDGMIGLAQAIRQIHFPDSWDEMHQARRRLAFDELFLIQLATLQKRLQWRRKQATYNLDVSPDQLEEFFRSLPFTLTAAQQRVIREITADVKLTQPMNRLLQGEVGSGKTVVSSAVIYLAYLNHLRSFLMAPTEILAFQHYQTLSDLLSPFGVSIGLYTGSKKFTQKNLSGGAKKTASVNKTGPKSKANQPGSGSSVPDVVVGTHALLSDSLTSGGIGLVVVDEQQRFGVMQRSILRSKTKIPHFLSMTATPIPRTAALTLYGDLDLSVIDELPKNRLPVKTFVVPDFKREAAYKFIEKKVKEGDQAYFITPLIEKSETIATAKAAKDEFERLKAKVFPHLRLGLLHGRLKSREKEVVITEFRDHKLDILISTSVVEVGVDVPGATIMVVEGAERFGLSQLHQLRGRIGRGSKQSFCFLFCGDNTAQSRNRLKYLERTSNGLKLSELDLKIRGSGDVFGTRQSGHFELKLASLSDLKLIEETRTLAKQVLDNSPSLDKYPRLQAKLQGILSGVMPD